MSTESVKTLVDAFEQTNDLVCEIVLRRRLSSSATQLVELETQLLELRDAHRLYGVLLKSAPRNVASNLDAAQPPVSRVDTVDALLHATEQLGQLLQKISHLLLSLPTAQSPPRDKPGKDSDTIGSLLELCHRDLQERIQAVDTAFRLTFRFLYRHTNEGGIRPGNDPLENIIAHTMAEFRSTPFSIGIADFEAIDKPLYDLTHSTEAWERFVGALAAEGKTWAVSMQELGNDKTFSLLCQWLLSGPLGDYPTLDALLYAQPIASLSRALRMAMRHFIMREHQSPNLVMFYGLSGVGKDAIINGLIGTEVLPMHTFAHTTCPCRFRHTPGQAEPKITVPPRVFTVVIDTIRSMEFNARRKRHEDPKCANGDATFKNLYKHWTALDNDCRALLDKIEAADYSFPLEAHGVVETRNLLRGLNTLGRLCRSMGVPFSLLRLDWPTVSVEFRWLKGTTESWEFLNVPGSRSAFGLGDDTDYLNHAIVEGATIVPIIGHQQEVVNLQAADFANTLRQDNVPLPCIIVTYLDSIGNDEERFTIDLTNKFYPRSPEGELSARPEPESHTEPDSVIKTQPNASSDVSPARDGAAVPSAHDLNSPSVGSAVLSTGGAPIFFCDVPLGTGVSNLLHRLSLTGEIPQFETLWTDPESADYKAARKIFGGPSYQAGYAAITIEDIKTAAAGVLSKTRLTLAFTELLSLVPRCSVSIRASMIQNIRERTSSLANDIGLLCGTNHVEGIWALPSMISQLESVVNAVQQEDQTTAKILEGALTEEVTRIRDETEAIILPTVEKVMSTHSMPHPKWMSDQSAVIMSRRQFDRFLDAFQKELQPQMLALADRFRQFVQRHSETSESFQSFQEHVRAGLEILRLDPLALSPEGLQRPLPDLLPPHEFYLHFERLQSRRFYLALYKACRDDLPIIHGRKPTWWRQSLSAFFAILPFLYRLPSTLQIVSRSPCLVRAFTIASFYLERVVQPWLSSMEVSLYSTTVEEMQKSRRALEGALSEKVVEWDHGLSTLRFLVSLRGNLSAVPTQADG